MRITQYKNYVNFQFKLKNRQYTKNRRYEDFK